MSTLSDDIYNEIKALCEEGDRLIFSSDRIGGLRKYHRAWKLLPEPKEDWDAATWILSAIGDAHFGLGDYRNAVSALSNALDCPDGLGNAFIHLRLGESYFELGDTAMAQNQLARAYMAAGKEMFQNEDQKYFAFLQSVLKPAPGQESI